MKGKVKPLAVHELVGAPGEVEPNVLQGVGLYTEGLAAYRARRFTEALEIFRAAQEAFGRDGPSRIMLERCAWFAKEPPPPDWDGVFVMKTK
jgi:adenylate cyclase